MAPDTNTTERHDVCIVGAGIAGLSALVVASEYLSPDGSVVLVDHRERPGGMWNDTYDYVRLHQPHPMFTAGDIRWELDEDRSYLATKGEVLDHLQHCYEVAADRVAVTQLFGWEEVSHRQVDGTVRITCRSTDGETRAIEADRLIRAPGFAVEPNDPLELSSEEVRSVSPDHCDMRGPEMAASDAPVWVIGGGKTGVDTAHTLITGQPGREVNLVAGSGTVFSQRERLFPRGVRRWWGGTRANFFFREAARRYDGTNGAAVLEWLLESYGTSLTPEARNYFAGILSEAETRTVAAGLRHVVMDHLTDVVDRDGRTELVLRSGDPLPVEPGSWFVNCTGYVLQRDQPHEPVVSPDGRVVSINMRAAVMPFAHFGGYLVTHLLLRDELADAPLYELDEIAVRSRAREHMPGAFFALAMHNLSVIIDRVPPKVMLKFGADFDRWYPLPRQLFGVARFMARHRKDREHCRRALDTLRERHDIAGGVRGG